MSFGSVVVDKHNPTWRFPGLAMLTGLLANAMGWDHRDVERLEALQNRLRFAARWDAEPELLVDYQTVDLGQTFLVGTGWTTRGQREERKGGSASKGTHIRYRHYLTNGVMTVALALDDDAVDPSVDTLEQALHTPARPLYLGRKTCLPATPILKRRCQAPSVKAALAAEPFAPIGTRRCPRKVNALCPRKVNALWPIEDGDGATAEERFDVRDWFNNIHLGSRHYAVGTLEVRA